MSPHRLRPADAARYVQLRERMLRSEPWAFGSSLEDDVLRRLDRARDVLARERNAIFAVEKPDAAEGTPGLVACASISRAQQPQFRHRARIWGLYVEPAFRREGHARRVMTAALEQARRWGGVDYVDLTVSENSPAAHALYQSLGFVGWGREPEATDYRGSRYDEIYMALRLPPGG